MMKGVIYKAGLLTVLLLCIVLTPLSAQTDTPSKNGVSIGQTAISREDTELVVDYNLLLGKNVKSCQVEVVMLVDGKPVVMNSSLSGDYGKMVSSGLKQIRYDVSSQKEYLAGKDISFTLNVTRLDVMKGRIVAIASVTPAPQFSCGLMLGYVKKFGGYAKVRTDFRSNKFSYTCTRDGHLDSGGVLWANGNVRKTRLQVTGGGLFRVSKWLYPYVGAGYGYRSVLWDDTAGNWAKVTDLSCNGFAAETGLIFKAGPVALSAGVSTTSFKYTELELGIGVMF